MNLQLSWGPECYRPQRRATPTLPLRVMMHQVTRRRLQAPPSKISDRIGPALDRIDNRDQVEDRTRRTSPMPTSAPLRAIADAVPESSTSAPTTAACTTVPARR